MFGKTGGSEKNGVSTTPQKQAVSTYLLAVEIGGRVSHRLPGRVGALRLDPVVELAVHDLERRRVAARELGVCHREEGVADRGADEVASD